MFWSLSFPSAAAVVVCPLLSHSGAELSKELEKRFSWSLQQLWGSQTSPWSFSCSSPFPRQNFPMAMQCLCPLEWGWGWGWRQPDPRAGVAAWGVRQRTQGSAQGSAPLLWQQHNRSRGWCSNTRPPLSERDLVAESTFLACKWYCVKYRLLWTVSSWGWFWKSSGSVSTPWCWVY